MKKQSIVGGFAILSICGLVAKLLSLIYVPVLKQILGGDGHGVYVVTYGVFAFIYTICNSGLPNSISKLVSEELELGNQRRAQRLFELSRLILITIGTLLSVVMFIFSDVIAEFMNTPDSSLAIKVLSPAVLVTSVLSSYKGYFQAQRIMTPTGISQVVEQLVNVFISLSVAFIFIKVGTNEGVAGATTGTTIGALGAIGIMIYFYRKNNLKSERNLALSAKYRKDDYNLIKRILLTAGPLTFCAAMQNLSFIMDPRQIGGRLQKVGMAAKAINNANGMVGRYQSLINVPVAIAMALAIAILPVISARIAVGNKEDARDKVNFVHKLCFLVTVPCAFGMGTLAYPIASIFGYSEGVGKMLTLGSFIIILMSLMQVQMAIMQGINKLYEITGITVFALGIKFLINHFSIERFGYLGVLLGNGIAFSIILILGTISINKALNGKVKMFESFMKPFIASAAMGVVVFGINKIMFYLLGGAGSKLNSLIVIGICIPLGVGVYGVMILLLRTITAEEYESMPGKIRRIIPRRFIK